MNLVIANVSVSINGDDFTKAVTAIGTQITGQLTSIKF